MELGDTLWNYRWVQAIQEVKPDIIEIGASGVKSSGQCLFLLILLVTWNDYGEMDLIFIPLSLSVIRIAESHYIGDINPNVDPGYAP